MSEALNTPLKYWPFHLGGALLVVLFALFAWDRDRERKLSEALAQAAQLQERFSRIDLVEERRAWERVEEAAAGLTDEDLKERKQALIRFRQELHRLKVRHAYPQLRGADPKLNHQPHQHPAYSENNLEDSSRDPDR